MDCTLIALPDLARLLEWTKNYIASNISCFPFDYYNGISKTKLWLNENWVRLYSQPLWKVEKCAPPQYIHMLIPPSYEHMLCGKGKLRLLTFKLGEYPRLFRCIQYNPRCIHFLKLEEESQWRSQSDVM